MKSKIVVLLSLAILLTACVWLVVEPSPEPLVAALAATVGILSQVGERSRRTRRDQEGEGSSEAKERSLLVLPLANQSPDRENEYFSDGLTEELISALAQVPLLRVISRHSAMRLKDTKKSLSELARDLSVDFIVEGGVRKHNGAIRITIHLVNAEEDTEIWAEKYDGSLEDVFAFQEAVAGSIVQALQLRFSPDKGHAAQAPQNPRAFEAYLRGRHEMGNWSREASENARRFFSNGLEILGENALLHAGYGHATFRLAHIVPGAMAEYMQEAERSAERALDLDPHLVTAHVLSGLVDWKKGSIGSGLRHFLQALETDPDDADALTWAVFCFAEVGDLEFLVPHVERLVLVDPIGSFTRFTEAYAALMSSKLTDASRAIEHSLALDPSSTNSIALAAYTDFHRGDSQGAITRLERMNEIVKEDVWTHLGRGLHAAMQGSDLQLPDSVLIDSQKDETFAWFIAECNAILGHPEEALAWLDIALQWGFSNVEYLTSEATSMRVVWDDPRFAEWVERAESRRRQVLTIAKG